MANSSIRPDLQISTNGSSNGDVITNVGGAAQWVASPFDGEYLRLDASNDPVTGQLNIEVNNLSESNLVIKSLDDDEANSPFKYLDSANNVVTELSVKDSGFTPDTFSSSPVFIIRNPTSNVHGRFWARGNTDGGDQMAWAGNLEAGGNRYMTITIKPTGTPFFGSGFQTFFSIGGGSQTNWLSQADETSIKVTSLVDYFSLHQQSVTADRTFVFNLKTGQLRVATGQSLGDHIGQFDLNVYDAGVVGQITTLAPGATADGYQLENSDNDPLISFNSSGGAQFNEQLNNTNFAVGNSVVTDGFKVDGTRDVISLGGGTMIEITNVAPAGATYDLGVDERTVFVPASAGPKTVNLPLIVNADDGSRTSEFRIVKSDATANVVTIQPQGGETINGAPNYALNAQYDGVIIQHNGTEWFILSTT